jgi:peptidoglycan/xylan/chitin deacetylase (PgdA/CDA1 family)
MRTGSQHDFYDYSPITERPPLQWPDGARIAVWVVPNIEHYEVTDASGTLDVKNFTKTDYGNRVAVWRMFEALDRREIPSTIALNSSICDHYPQIVSACVERDCEFIGHGITNSEHLTKLSPEDAKANIETSLKAVGEATGKPVRGWLGPALGESGNTLEVLAENGVEYVCDWGVVDDQPFRMRNGLYAMPYSLELNDTPVFRDYGTPPADFCQYICDAFDVLHREGGRVLCISVHPFLMGTPHRFKYFEQALDYIGGHEGVWWTQAGQILDAYLAQTHEIEGSTT